jgi:hypothetical protein
VRLGGNSTWMISRLTGRVESPAVLVEIPAMVWPTRRPGVRRLYESARPPGTTLSVLLTLDQFHDIQHLVVCDFLARGWLSYAGSWPR